MSAPRVEELGGDKKEGIRGSVRVLCSVAFRKKEETLPIHYSALKGDLSKKLQLCYSDRSPGGGLRGSLTWEFRAERYMVARSSAKQRHVYFWPLF